ncbi:type VI secretion protein IcmF/TssM N-terminal domain-containing protein [Pseudomonas aeruginosa]|nr:type VI secretion protein IcmF/TssM N-terminal domain-containing protein [Pseudomonas aeruginosa]
MRLFPRLRGRRALDGVVWNISLARLQDGEQAAALGLAARRRYVELTQRLGLSLPVYVVITGLEDLPGFQELRGAARGGASAPSAGPRRSPPRRPGSRAGASRRWRKSPPP